jgi:hypothetical protein
VEEQKKMEEPIKKLAELVPSKLTNSSLISKLSLVHQDIVNTVKKEDDALTKVELKTLVVRVVAQHGIKELPAKEIMALCFESWNSRFVTKMNKKELFLAFEMNVNGDFNFKENGEVKRRVNHYNNFSREFFCDVLNQYLSEKEVAHGKYAALRLAEEKEQAAVPVNAPDVTVEILRALIQDFKAYHTEGLSYSHPENSFHTSSGFPTDTKLEMLGELFDIDISEDKLTGLRELAARRLIRSLIKKRAEIPTSKMGAALEISHQIARIKTGKLITDKDEILLQGIVKQLLCMQVFDNMKPERDVPIEDSVFVMHIKENITLYNKNSKP